MMIIERRCMCVSLPLSFSLFKPGIGRATAVQAGTLHPAANTGKTTRPRLLLISLQYTSFVGTMIYSNLACSYSISFSTVGGSNADVTPLHQPTTKDYQSREKSEYARSPPMKSRIAVETSTMVSPLSILCCSGPIVCKTQRCY